MGLPVATAVIVLIVVISVPICIVVMIVLCIRKAQVEKSKSVTQTKVVRVPQNNSKNNYNSRSYASGRTHTSKPYSSSVDPRKKEDDFVEPLISQTEEMTQLGTGSNSYQPPALPQQPQSQPSQGLGQSQGYVLVLPDQSASLQPQPQPQPQQPFQQSTSQVALDQPQQSDTSDYSQTDVEGLRSDVTSESSFGTAQEGQESSLLGEESSMQ